MLKRWIVLSVLAGQMLVTEVDAVNVTCALAVALIEYGVVEADVISVRLKGL